MSLLRVAFLELLVSVHVLGAAMYFRRLFPRESPWLGFIVPIVAIVSALNFLEHFVALPALGWLLPLTLGGAIWSLLRPGNTWEGLRYPTALFLAAFTFLFLLKCIAPDIPNYTEGAADLTRVLNYCLGEKVPPTDCWMPPYDSGGYYTFQHYGASVLKRLFSVDVGTAVNVSFALLLALLCQMAGAVAWTLTGKKWISLLTVLILIAGSTGSAPILLLLGHFDYGLSTDLNTGWDNPAFNPFAWLCAHDKIHSNLTLVSPAYTIYCSEYHGNLGGTVLTMAILLAAFEAGGAERRDWPWICLLVLPLVTIVTSAWYFLLAAFFAAVGLLIALLAGKRPQNWKMVAVTSMVGLFFIWPSFVSLSANPFMQSFIPTAPEDRTPLWMFGLQWWPIFVPWLLLCFVWDRLNGLSRWVHAALPLLFIGMEFVSLSDRSLTVQKMWGDLYGIGLIVLLPQLFVQRGVLFRCVTIFFAATFLYCLVMWQKIVYFDHRDPNEFGMLRGDSGILLDTQRKRILQVLDGLHAATVLPGRSYWAYNLAPLVVSLSENRCFVAYTFQEGQAGHGGEIDYRSRLNNNFYDGVMTAPLPFLHSNDIAAIVIWPEDTISDTMLQQIKTEIGSEYSYVDCKADGVPNAGVFLRQTDTAPENTPGPPASLDFTPHPYP